MKFRKSLLVLILVVSLVFTAVPMTALAEESAAAGVPATDVQSRVGLVDDSAAIEAEIDAAIQNLEAEGAAKAPALKASADSASDAENDVVISEDGSESFVGEWVS